MEGCVFAPYFSHDQGALHFSSVHKVFGASNVSKLLLHIPLHRRSEAAATISFEAQARMRDPVYGCVAYIFSLQRQVARLQQEIDSLTMNPSTYNNTNIWNNGGVSEFTPNQHGYYVNFSSSNSDATLAVDRSTQPDHEDDHPAELHPLFREAIDRLEHSLFSDIVEDDPPAVGMYGCVG